MGVSVKSQMRGQAKGEAQCLGFSIQSLVASAFKQQDYDAYPRLNPEGQATIMR
jgi:hypothetical protein